MNEDDIPWRYRERHSLTALERWVYRAMIIGIVLFWFAVVWIVKWMHG
jgi:hypothetical protein